MNTPITGTLPDIDFNAAFTNLVDEYNQGVRETPFVENLSRKTIAGIVKNDKGEDRAIFLELQSDPTKFVEHSDVTFNEDDGAWVAVANLKAENGDLVQMRMRIGEPGMSQA